LPPLDATQISEVSEITKFRKRQSIVYGLSWHIVSSICPRREFWNYFF